MMPPTETEPLVADQVGRGGAAASEDDLLARYREAADAFRNNQGDFRAWSCAGRDLIANPSEATVREWLCSERRTHAWTGPGGREGEFSGSLRGLVLRGGGGTGFPADNPWGIAADADVERTIRQVWAPVAADVPAVVDCLVERVYAVAMVAHDDGDCLAYLQGGGEPPGGGSTWATATIPDLLSDPESTPEVCWGDAPRTLSDREDVDLLGRPLPTAMRKLAAVHGSLYFSNYEGWVDVGRMYPYKGWVNDGDTAAAEERCVVFAGFQDGSYVVDRDRLDGPGAPVVAAHDCNDGLDPTCTAPFWVWFDGEIRLWLTED